MGSVPSFVFQYTKIPRFSILICLWLERSWYSNHPAINLDYLAPKDFGTASIIWSGPSKVSLPKAAPPWICFSPICWWSSKHVLPWSNLVHWWQQLHDRWETGFRLGHCQSLRGHWVWSPAWQLHFGPKNGTALTGNLQCSSHMWPLTP